MLRCYCCLFLLQQDHTTTTLYLLAAFRTATNTRPRTVSEVVADLWNSPDFNPVAPHRIAILISIPLLSAHMSRWQHFLQRRRSASRTSSPQCAQACCESSQGGSRAGKAKVAMLVRKNKELSMRKPCHQLQQMATKSTTTIIYTIILLNKETLDQLIGNRHVLFNTSCISEWLTVICSLFLGGRRKSPTSQLVT